MKLVGLLPFLAGGLVAAFASCAANDDDPKLDTDAASPIPPVDAANADADSDDAPAEAGCDASDRDCIKEVVPCDAVEWCMVDNPVHRLHALASVWGTSKDDIWAVGSGGTILHYDGHTWLKLPSDRPETFRVVWGSGPKDVWVAATTSLMLHGTGFEGGAALWKNMAPSVSSTAWSGAAGRVVNALWGSSATDVHIGSRATSVGIENEDQSFWYSGPSNQFVTGKKPSGDLIWRLLPGTDFIITSIWGSSADDVWMTVDNSAYVPHERGLTLHGTPYVRPGPNPNILPRGAQCSDCSPGCTLCALVDDPLLWTRVDSQSSVALEATWGSSADDVWTVGDNGTIRRFRKGDTRWQKIESPTTQTLHAVWGSGPNDVWIVGDAGTILHFDGAKVTASSVQLPVGKKPDLRSVWGSGPNDVWIVGDVLTLHFTGPKPGAPRGDQ